MADEHVAPWSVLVLSGGRSARLGHDKTRATIGGRTLLDHVLSSIPTNIPCVVVGPAPTSTPRAVVVVTEDPPGGGPVSGVATGLAHIATPVVIIWAADMPFAGTLVAKLAADMTQGEADALIPVDDTGRRQPLAAAYRTDALRAALAQLGLAYGRAVHELLALINITEVAVDPEATHTLFDIDTADDLAMARRSVAQTETATTMKDPMSDWVTAATAALGIDADVDVDTILDLAREAAHGVERPAAPVSTYLLGYAVAHGMSLTEASERLTRLAREWPTPE